MSASVSSQTGKAVDETHDHSRPAGTLLLSVLAGKARAGEVEVTVELLMNRVLQNELLVG